MHGSSGGTSGKKARIEIIPLIDIIFFLLATFIMVSLSMNKNQGINVSVPTAGATTDAPVRDRERPVSLVVNVKGEVLYNGEKMTPAQVPIKLQSYKSQAKDPRVTVCGEADTPLQLVISVYDQAKLTGIQKVALNVAK